MIREITALELKARRDAGDHPLVIDVREGYEVAAASIPDTLHIPMNEIPERLGELDAGRETIIMCRSGGRSLRVAQFMAGHGFGNVVNLAGGILAWAEDVDPSVPAT